MVVERLLVHVVRLLFRFTFSKGWGQYKTSPVLDIRGADGFKITWSNPAIPSSSSAYGFLFLVILMYVFRYIVGRQTYDNDYGLWFHRNKTFVRWQRFLLSFSRFCMLDKKYGLRVMTSLHFVSVFPLRLLTG